MPILPPHLHLHCNRIAGSALSTTKSPTTGTTASTTTATTTPFIEAAGRSVAATTTVSVGRSPSRGSSLAIEDLPVVINLLKQTVDGEGVVRRVEHQQIATDDKLACITSIKDEQEVANVLNVR